MYVTFVAKSWSPVLQIITGKVVTTFRLAFVRYTFRGPAWSRLYFVKCVRIS